MKNSEKHILSVGHAVFAATMTALGVLALREGNLAPVWAPLPKGVPARGLVVDLCALVCLGSGLGLFWPRTAIVAARVLLAWFLLWSLLFNLPTAFPAPTVLGSWYGCAEIAVTTAGTWVLYTWFATEWDKRWFGFATGDKGVRIARILYGLALIFFGLGHFAYIEPTVALVPNWLPAHLFWAYFTGGAFVAGGLAVLIGVWAKLAAALMALQIGLFIPLIWLPLVATGQISAFRWGEFVATCALTAGAWVMADSYRIIPGRGGTSATGLLHARGQRT